MLTLRIEDDKIVSQSKGEETMSTNSQNTGPDAVHQMHQDTSQTAPKPGNGQTPDSAENTVDFTANLMSGQLENFATIHRAQMEAIAQASRTLMEGLIAINREASDFRNQRASTLVEDSSEMPSLTDVGKILNFQINYVDRATQAYLEEATKLFEIGVKIAEESYAPIQESTTRALRDVLNKDG